MKPLRLSLSVIVARVLVVAGALVMLVPFWLMFVFATHTRGEINSLPLPWFFGSALGENMAILRAAIPFWRSVGWSLYVALLSTTLTLFFCSLAGYAFARLEFPWRVALFRVVMATLLLPSFINMIPTYMLMGQLGWIDQHRALYIPGAASAFGIFLVRQYAGSAIPIELIEAARLEGCSEWRIYWHVALPLLRPALGTLGLISFIASWNNFMGPLVVMQSDANQTLPVALRTLLTRSDIEWGALMAGSAIATLPLVVLFAICSRQLIAGLTAGAVK